MSPSPPSQTTRRTLPPFLSHVALCAFLLGPALLGATAPAHAQEAPPNEAEAAEAVAAETAPTVASSEAAFEFTLAKMLMDEGDYRAAQVAFERALEADPEAAYVRLEYAEFLGRLGRFGRSHEARLERLREAVSEAQRAQTALGENPDSLRVLAEVQLALATETPQDPAPMAAAVAALERLRAEGEGDVRSLLQLGQIYLRQGEAEPAAEVFQEVVDVSPGYRPAYRMLAEALIQSGQLDRADEALRHVIEGEPDAESARLALAEILADRGDHKEAADVLRSSPEELTTTEARSRLATELYLSGDLDNALAELDGLLTEVPDSRFLQLLRGLVLSAQARNEEALAALEPLMGEGPGEASLARTVSQLLVREERDDEAVELLQGTVEKLDADGPPSEATDARMALARLYATLDRWASVETTLAPLMGREARTGAPLEARLLYADSLAEQGRGEEALRRLDLEASSDESAQAPIQAKRAELLARVGREREAYDLLTAAAGGERSENFLEIAEGLHRAERYQETVAPLESFVRETPDSVVGRFLLGAAQERAGDRSAAEATFDGLLASDPDYHPALNYLGYMWIESGANLERAVGMVERAVALDPGNGAYIDSLGWGYYQLGRYEEARETLERAARLVADPTIFEHLGDVYAALGERAEARRAYRRAMALEADDPEAVARKLSALDHPETGVEGETHRPERQQREPR